jgi:hypothetical protein
MASFETDAGEGVGRTEAAARSLREQLEAFGRAGALERRCHHVAGELAGAQVLRLRVHDLIVHGWDLAQALHPPAAVPPDLVRWAVAELSGPASLTAGHFAIAPADLAGGPGPDQGRALLAAFGRPV